MKCVVCKAKDEELRHLRKLVSELSQHVVRITDRMVPEPYRSEFNPQSTWSGGDIDQIVHDEFGEKSIVKVE